MEQTLSSTQVCRAAGITYRNLDYWTRRGLAHPLVAARGCGSQRRWSAQEAEVLRSMASWRAVGASLELAREMAEQGLVIAYETKPLLQHSAA